MTREIYLDNSATTKPFEEVTDYISEINRNCYGNPSSLHTKGIEAEKLVNKARRIIADSIGAEAKEIYFTSGGTEANNLAVLGYLEANIRKGKHIAASAIEHPSVLEIYKHLASKGYKVDYIKVDKSGIVDIEHLKSVISNETALISVMLVNNETGSVQPIETIVKLKNSINRDTAIHVDAVQAYGKMNINPAKSGIDIMTVSSHKIHGPKGVGAIYVDKGVKIKPIIFGGGQESLLRSGTENVPGICGFSLAAEMMHSKIDLNISRVARLKKLFLELLESKLDDYCIISPENGFAYILSISFSGVKSEVLLHHLEERGIFVSTGSACSSRKNIHSHVLKAMGLKASDIDGAVRFSFSSFNTEEEIEQTVEALKEIVLKIRVKRLK
ncbi:MAG: cysteine desulfurase [Clostridia bacterium]|nr:cysteine desulfurase [Clostridia bacterium]